MCVWLLRLLFSSVGSRRRRRCDSEWVLLVVVVVKAAEPGLFPSLGARPGVEAATLAASVYCLAE